MKMKKLLTLLTLLTLSALMTACPNPLDKDYDGEDDKVEINNYGDNNENNVGENKNAPAPTPTPVPTLLPVAEAGLPFVFFVCFVVAAFFPGCVVIVKRDLVLEPKANLNMPIAAWKPTLGVTTTEESTNSVSEVAADNASETAAQVEGLAP